MPPNPERIAPVVEPAKAVGSMNAGLQPLATWHCEQSCGKGGVDPVPRWFGWTFGSR
jgi:hypothetical protein